MVKVTPGDRGRGVHIMSKTATGWFRYIAGAALALLALAGTPPAAQAQKATNTLVWGMVASPRHLNPAVQSGINTMEPGAQIFASPLRVNDKWELQPYLAESFKYEDDNRSLVLKVRKGATFHDGKPITSADFAFSIMAVKANHPFQAMMEAVERVDTPDAETAIIRL